MYIIIGYILKGLILTYIVKSSRKKQNLTESAILFALITGVIHSISSTFLYLILLIVFFLMGTKATKYKHEYKEKLTKAYNIDGDSTSNKRNHIQVLANSLAASFYILVILLISLTDTGSENSKNWIKLLEIGIVSHYCSVTSDTLSSELGILSKSDPILITSFKTVPKGTNGAISIMGFVSGVTGSFIISVVYVIFRFNEFDSILNLIASLLFLTFTGLVGTFIDSLLGAILQTTFVDSSSNKVIEINGGYQLHKNKFANSKIQSISGFDILSNNGVNLLMSFMSSGLSMLAYNIIF